MYLHPRPYQQPHPPVWFDVEHAPKPTGSRGAKGMQVIGMSNPPRKTRRCWSAFQQAASGARQREVALGEGVGICVVVYVAENDGTSGAGRALGDKRLLRDVQRLAPQRRVRETARTWTRARR